MQDTIDFLYGLVVGAIAMLFISTIWNEKHLTIVSHGCAHYDTSNGKFTWNDINDTNK